MVLPLDDAGEGKSKTFRIKAFKEKWAWTPREWTKVTQDTGIGNPKYATSVKGKKFVNSVSEKIAQFLIELSETNISDMY